PAVSGDDSGAVVPVALLYRAVHRLRGVENAEVVVNAVELGVGRGADRKGLVEPGEVAVGAVAAELRLQFAMLDLPALLLRQRFDRGVRADVVDADSLVLVDQEDRALRSGDQLLDLVLAEVAVEPASLVEAVRFVDDQHVELVRFGSNE